MRTNALYVKTCMGNEHNLKQHIARVHKWASKAIFNCFFFNFFFLTLFDDYFLCFLVT